MTIQLHKRSFEKDNRGFDVQYYPNNNSTQLGIKPNLWVYIGTWLLFFMIKNIKPMQRVLYRSEAQE